MQTPDAHTSPKSAWPLIAGALVLLLVFAFAVKILTGLGAAVPDEDAARSAERVKARETLDAEDKLKLEGYAWSDKAKGTVQIPIKQAMELTVAELQGKQPQPAGPIATPAPAPAPEAAVPAAPAPAATAP